MILARFSLLEINDIEAGRIAHIRQVNVNNIEDFSGVVSEGLLDERCIDINSAAEHVGGLFIDHMSFEFDRSVLSIEHLVYTALTRVELNFVFLHSETFREHLLCHALRLSIDVHDLVLDNELAILTIQHTLANVVLFVLRQDEVVLVEHRPTDLLVNFLISVTLVDQDAVGIEKKLKLHSALVLVIINNLVDGILDHHGLHQAAFNADSNLLDYVLETMILDVDLRLQVLYRAKIIFLLSISLNTLEVSDVCNCVGMLF